MHPQRKMLHWSVAVSVAFAAHLLLVVGYMGLNPYGAAGEGQGGIEIGLGMLGDMGESLATADGAETMQLPVEQPPEPMQTEFQPPPTDPETPQQVTEVAVQTNTVEEIIPVVEQSQTAEPVTDAPAIGPQTGVQAAAPSAGGSTGNDAITQRREGSGAGDSPGAGGSRGRQAAYAATLAAQINRYKHYPMAARRAREEGTATLSLVILRDGTVKDFRISKSSGADALDAAVLRMLERAQPLPAFPASMTEDEIRVDFPVSFSLQAL
ncbi:MAG: energy transducer TonB [Gammaproteobacteria bacterium]|nr:energy transducer TonB [Gammaproteobacteria bacterium]